MRPARRPVWFFDLDDTLHDASHAIYRAIDTRMTDFVARHLRIERDAANRLRQTYWRRYGATMLGLIRHHAVDPHRFLRETHDFDVASLLRAERGLTRLFARLPGRKVLLTNAPIDYAERVLRGIGLQRHIRTRYSIESMRIHGTYRPKPSRSMLRSMLARERLSGRPNARRAILVDDNPENLKAAWAVGFSTVLLARRNSGRPARLAGLPYLCARVRSVAQLPAVMARLGSAAR